MEKGELDDWSVGSVQMEKGELDDWSIGSVQIEKRVRQLVCRLSADGERRVR